jgi:hypothetical protein
MSQEEEEVDACREGMEVDTKEERVRGEQATPQRLYI